MSRPNNSEKSLFSQIAQKGSQVTREVLLPPGTRRAGFLFHAIQWLRSHFRPIPQQNREGKRDASQIGDSIRPTETLNPGEVEPLRFMTVSRPKVSIVIPTWNRAVYVYRCLKFLLSSTSGVSYEVVVVDDGSTDETAEVLNKIENIRVIRNGANQGFAKSCNEGAREAGGEYLLFLNNDTQVTDGWLEAMVSWVDSDQSIGAVGAKLVLPDGRLQEAGSIIWRDGSALGYGRGEDPELPQFCYPRDVDFCSAACLLVRKEIFDRLGGFDEMYSPAYYEDADLCLGIRRLGFRVVYNPDARIIHHEFGSSSQKESTDLCLRNRKKFVEKWGEVLKENHIPAGPENILRARNKRKGSRILVLDDIIPVSAMGSGYPRSNAILKDLTELGYVVTFCPLADPFPPQPDTNELKRMGIEVLYGEESTEVREWPLARKGFYDAVLVSRPHNAAFIIEKLRKAFPQTRIIYDAEAIYANREIHQRRLSGVDVGEEEREKMIVQELAPMKYADAIIVTSEYEKRQVSSFRTRDVFVWGHPLEVKTPEKKYPEREGLLFVGGFLRSPSPNEDAVLHFVKDIFPQIRGPLGSHLFIVGTNHLESIKTLVSDSLTVTGYVEDLRVYYERARVFVVPTRFAAGIPLKLLEAMSHGIPAVVTPLVALQLGLSEGEGVLIGRDDGDFAKKTIELYRNEGLWDELGKKALEHVRVHCDPEKMKRHLDRIIKGG